MHWFSVTAAVEVVVVVAEVTLSETPPTIPAQTVGASFLVGQEPVPITHSELCLNVVCT
jgi:hypothetical protein